MSDLLKSFTTFALDETTKPIEVFVNTHFSNTPTEAEAKGLPFNLSLDEVTYAAVVNTSDRKSYEVEKILKGTTYEVGRTIVPDPV